MVRIVCEGKTDKNKIQELLDYLKIKYNDNNFIVAGSKSVIFKEDIPQYKTLLVLVNQGKVEKVLFIVDADYKKDNAQYGGYQNTKRELNKLIEKLDIKVPCTKYIMCDPNSKDGYLESLLLSTVDDNPKKCHKKFLDCIEFEDKDNHKYIMGQLHKIYKSDRPYNFEHPNFQNLKDILVSLFAKQ